MLKTIIKFFDKIEDKTRAILSHHPIIYAFIGGVGMTLFWRGVWLTADLFPFMTGPVSIIVSMVILLITGLLVSVFIGHHIILTGIKQEKKIEERTEAEIKSEIKTEEDAFNDIKAKIENIYNDIQELKSSKIKRPSKISKK